MANLPDDVLNAERFHERFGYESKFVGEYKRWLHWTGSYWRQDNGNVQNWAMRVLESFSEEANDALARGDMEAYKTLTRHVVKSAGRVDTMLKLASSMSDIRINASDLDFSRNWLNCRNATLDLTEDSLQGHNPNDLITRITNAAYLPTATAPSWDAFLNQVLPDPEVQAYIQRLVGYSLLGEANERIVVFLYGLGRNGKSVFVETLREVLGTYALGTPVQTFLEGSRGLSNDLARLKGTRFIVSSEFEEGSRANAALLKQVTGGEKITARYLYGEFFDFDLEGTIWISTNHIPYLGHGPAVWDRVKVVGFEQRIPESQVDIHIKARLLKEKSGILNWCVEGTRQYLKRGIDEPAICRMSTSSAKEDQDMLKPFFTDCFVMDPQGSVSASSLFKTYQFWAINNGEKPQSARWLGLRMRDNGFSSTNAGNVRQWKGLRHKDA